MNARLNQPTYELHPLCVLFPRMAGGEFDALREDIRANGLRTPIVLHDGMILDGGNRYRACMEAGVEPEFVPFTGENLASFVLSVNLHRRHMSAGQQAAIVASAQDWSKAHTVGSNQHKAKAEAGPATLPDHLATVAQRAAESGASERTQRMADKVAKADPELAVRVGHGEVSLPKAHAEVSKPAKPKKPKPVPVEEAPAVDGPSEVDPRDARIEELARELSAALDENTRMGEVFDADDKLAAAMASNAALADENKQLKAQIVQLRERINGLVGEGGQQIRRIKAMAAKLKKAGLE